MTKVSYHTGHVQLVDRSIDLSCESHRSMVPFSCSSTRWMIENVQHTYQAQVEHVWNDCSRYLVRIGCWEDRQTTERVGSFKLQCAWASRRRLDMYCAVLYSDLESWRRVGFTARNIDCQITAPCWLTLL